MPIGRKRPAWAPIKRNFLNIPGSPGAKLLNTEIEARRIDVPLIVKGADIGDLQKVKEDLADWLVTKQECELIFDDEPDRTYLAVVDGSFDPEELVNRGKGIVTFVATMPYKLGKVNKHKFVREEATELTSYFENTGTEETPPLIEINVKQPATFLDVFFGEYPENRDYFRLGHPLTIMQKPAQQRERVMWDDMSNVIGWTPVKGVFDDMKGTGELKVKDGTALYCPYYGEEGTAGFHGGLAKKNIPGGPLQDFELEAWVHLQSRNADQMGRVEIILLDETSNMVAQINMSDLYWDAEITKAHMTLGDNAVPGSRRLLVETSGAHPNTFNQFYGRLRIARRGREWSVYVARFRDGTEIDDASLVERWTDSETNPNPMTARKVAQVMIAICRWDRNTPVYTMQIDDLKIWKLNNIDTNAVPYIFDTGDKVVIDSEYGHVTINGKNAIDLKEVVSEFPLIVRGENRIDIRPTELDATISYRERFK
ncbi:distal tail protein [Bacillus phage vB_BtS_B83]|nr:tail protein [Bacillus phage vB_BtS_B83]QCQ57801.1 distal tail protein [Bacillus phage vB_BtS_B83]